MINLKRTDSGHEDFQKLVRELDEYLSIINGDNDGFFAQYNKVDLIKDVVIAYDKSEPVGCGAMKRYTDGVMEIKRMFVISNNRGQGIASEILMELQDWAKELGYKKCILETDKKMLDAIALYQKHHFQITPNYGQYIGIDTSVCFEKLL